MSYIPKPCGFYHKDDNNIEFVVFTSDIIQFQKLYRKKDMILCRACYEEKMPFRCQYRIYQLNETVTRDEWKAFRQEEAKRRHEYALSQLKKTAQ